jgi:hypothetical protein
MNNKIKSINNKISKLQQETRALIKQRDEELEKIVIKKKIWKEYIGKTYVYRDNCYSHPEKNDYWNTYYKIVSYDEDKKTYQYFSFQKDSNGYITILLKNLYSNSDGTPGADISITQPVSEEEYEEARAKVLWNFIEDADCNLREKRF